MHSAAYSRQSACTGQMLQYVVHRHHIRTTYVPWHPEKMRNVNQAASQPLDDTTIFQITRNRSFGLLQRDDFEIGREKTYFGSTLRRAEKKEIGRASCRERV